MTEEQIALGRRAVACKGWRWMAGMQFDLGNPGAMLTGGRVERAEMRFLPRWTSEVLMITAGVCEFIVSPRGNIHVRFTGGAVPEKMDGGWMLPVLDDPATLGCLLALVREARGDTTIGVIRQDLGRMRSEKAWFICGEGGADVAWAYTEIDALLDALEVA